VYQLAIDRLSLAPGEILFLASNAWDAYTASAFGLRDHRAERLPGARGCAMLA
jgi:2-haloacid dehalogenase